MNKDQVFYSSSSPFSCPATWRSCSTLRLVGQGGQAPSNINGMRGYGPLSCWSVCVRVCVSIDHKEQQHVLHFLRRSTVLRWEATWPVMEQQWMCIYACVFCWAQQLCVFPLLSPSRSRVVNHRVLWFSSARDHTLPHTALPHHLQDLSTLREHKADCGLHANAVS